MKTIAAELAYFLRGRARQNLKYLIFYFVFLIAVIFVYAALFQYFMLHLEGREYSFVAGIYWTITVMTTLGFGDITFHSDAGFIFAMIVTLTGVILLLIILPFSLISLFLAPWIEHRLRYRPTHELPPDTSSHVLIFGLDTVTRALLRKLRTRDISFTIVTPDYQEAVRLEEDEGLQVVCGAPTDRRVLKAVRAQQARYIVANLSDPQNADLCLSVRAFCNTPIVALAAEATHADLLRLAGANQVVPLYRILGRYLASRATTQGAMAHILDSFGSLRIAEIPVHATPFAGQTLAEAQVRQRTGLAVIGVWERGTFTVPDADTRLDEKSLIVLAGTREQLTALEELTGEQAEDDLVFILGHGRIGCAAARFLDRKPVPFILIDQCENPDCEEHVAIQADATGRNVLKQAGIDNARGLIVTTNDDSTNIFLTLAARHTQSHIRIVARANLDESVPQLYAAGADFVVSNASVGANILFNIIESKVSAFLTEGINVFRRPLPAQLAGLTIAESRIRPRTGCSVVALETENGQDPLVVPPPETRLERGMKLILIGSPQQEEQYSKQFPQP